MFIYLYIFESFHSFRDSRQEDSIFHDQHFNPEQIFPPMLTFFFIFFGWFRLNWTVNLLTDTKVWLNPWRKVFSCFHLLTEEESHVFLFFLIPGIFWIPHRNFWNIFLCDCVIDSRISCCRGNRDRQTTTAARLGFVDRLRTSPRCDGLFWTVESHESNFPPDVSPVLCAAHEDDGICGPVFPTNTNKSSLCSLTERRCLLSKLS